MQNNPIPIKWLRILFYIHLALLAASVLSWLPMPDQWIAWIQRILVIATALCLFRLSSVNDHYRKAALFRIIYIGGLLITALLFSSTAITLAASVCSIIAVYHEYSAHSDLITQQDPRLSRKWHSLFNWSIAAAILVSFGSLVISMISVLIGMDITAAVTVVMVILSIPQFAVDVFYLIYLNRMLQLLRKED